MSGRSSAAAHLLCAALLWLIGPFVGAAVAEKPVEVAAIFSCSGIAAEHNAPLLPMIELAVEEVNERGGLLGRPAKLVILDNQSTPIGSMRAAEEAVRMGVLAVIGAHWSSHSLAMAPILEAAGIPMICPGSTNPDLTRQGSYIFRACFVDSFQGAAMARFATRELGAKRAVVLKNIDESYSLTLAEYFATSFRHFGGEVLLDGDYRGKAVDFADTLEKVKKLKPDVLYVPGYTRDSGLLIRQAVSMGIRTTFLGGDAWDEIYPYAGDALEGSFQSAPWHPDVPFSRSVDLQKAYRRKLGTEIASFSAPLAYDAFLLLENAVQRAGTTTDRSKIRDALASTKDFQGATGGYCFDDHGDPKHKGVIILKWEKGSAHFHKTIEAQ